MYNGSCKHVFKIDRMEPNLKDLLLQYLSGQISTADQTTLYSMLLDDRNEAEAKIILREISENTTADKSYRAADWELMINAILSLESVIENRPLISNAEKAVLLKERTISEKFIQRMPLRKMNLALAAASIIVLLGLTVYFEFIYKVKFIDAEPNKNAAVVADFAPASNKAVLILSTGQKIILDSAKNGQLAKFGNTTISKTDSGKLLYSSTGSKINAEESSFNSLTTPRGGIYELTLPDGTKAWLNAASRIDYPTRFTDKKREVFIEGEVYFEVAHDEAHPFLVSLGTKTKEQGERGHWTQIEVLGTHFNVNAYDDNGNPARTTLLEGSIKISAHGENRIIEPGEQAITGFESKSIGIDQHVNIDKVMAWRNGRIAITDVSVQQLMTEISRWYDVDIEYAGAVPDKQFYGSIRRDVPLSTVLHALEAYGVKIKIEGKKIIVQ